MILDLCDIGTVVDNRYEIIGHLGDGGMGHVYQAREIGLERTIAIKFLALELFGDEDSLHRFEREGKILAEINHPNILKVFRFGLWKIQENRGGKHSYNYFPYIAMEYLQGKTVRELLDSQVRLESELSATIAFDVCCGMAAAHSQGIIHRDLKPTNLIVDHQQTKILDFGLAGVISSQDSASQRLTQTGTLIGTVNYMSPEQCAGKRADHRTDIYALGCVMYEMVTGRPPFEADTPIGIMHKHATEHATTPSKVVGKLPSGLESIIEKAMCKNIEERYQSMDEFAHDLRLFIDGKAEQIEPNRPGNLRKVGTNKSVILCVVITAFLFSGIFYQCLVARNGPFSTYGSHHWDTNKIKPVGLSALVQKFQTESGSARDELAMKIIARNNRVQLLPENEVDRVYSYAANSLFEKGQISQANDILQAALTLIEKPESEAYRSIQMHIAHLKMREGNEAEAQALIKKVLQCRDQSDPKIVDLYTKLGHCQFLLKDYAAAKLSFEKALALSKVISSNVVEPMALTSIAYLGTMYAQSGDLKKEQNLYRTHWCPGNPILFDAIADQVERDPDQSRALRRSDNLISLMQEIDPDRVADARCVKADVLICSRQVRQGVDLMRRNIKLVNQKFSARVARYYSTLGVALKGLGANDTEDVLKVAQNVGAAKHKAEAILRLGIYYAERKNWKLANQCFSNLKTLAATSSFVASPDQLYQLFYITAAHAQSPAIAADYMKTCAELLARNMSPPDFICNACMEQVRYLMSDSNPAAAQQVLLDLLAGNPRTSLSQTERKRIAIKRVEILAKRGRLSHAQQVWKDAVGDSEAELRLSLRCWASEATQPQIAEKMLDFALSNAETDIERANILLNKAQYHLSQRKFQQVTTDLDLFEKEFPSFKIREADLPALQCSYETVYAIALLYSGHAKEALVHLLKGQKIAATYNLQPQERIVCFYLAHAYEVSCDYKQAALALDRAEILSPNDPEIEFHRAMLDARRGNKNRALAKLKELFEEQKKNCLDTNVAVYILDGLITLDPTNKEKYETLARDSISASKTCQAATNRLASSK